MLFHYHSFIAKIMNRMNNLLHTHTAVRVCVCQSERAPWALLLSTCGTHVCCLLTLTHIPLIHVASANQTAQFASASAGQQEAELHYVNKERMLLRSSLPLYCFSSAFTLHTTTLGTDQYQTGPKWFKPSPEPRPDQTSTALTCRGPCEPGRALQVDPLGSGSLHPQSLCFIFCRTTCDLWPWHPHRKLWGWTTRRF